MVEVKLDVFEEFSTGVSFDCDVDFLCIGLIMVKTLVLEPKGPSIDMVNQEG